MLPRKDTLGPDLTGPGSFGRTCCRRLGTAVRSLHCPTKVVGCTRLGTLSYPVHVVSVSLWARQTGRHPVATWTALLWDNSFEILFSRTRLVFFFLAWRRQAQHRPWRRSQHDMCQSRRERRLTWCVPTRTERCIEMGFGRWGNGRVCWVRNDVGCCFPTSNFALRQVAFVDGRRSFPKEHRGLTTRQTFLLRIDSTGTNSNERIRNIELFPHYAFHDTDFG